MSINDTGCWLEARAGASADNALEVLERFGLALQQADQSRAQVRLTLEATRDSLAAEVAFWHPGSTSDELDASGTTVLPAGWCRAFMDHLLPSLPPGEGQVVQQYLDPAARPLTPWPTSVVMVKISKSRNSWLVALSFHPRRLFTPTDLRVLLLARRVLLNHRQQAQMYEKLRDSLFGLVRCLTAAIDAKDPYTWGHSERVGRIAVRLGQEMGLPGPVTSDLYLGGLLHDIGKIGIRDNVLQKPGKLTDEEMSHIMEHPVIGDRLITNIKTLQHLRPAVRNHHERWDGRGYPDGLAAEGIPLQARILAVADACDAMMAARPYRPALPPERIGSIMRDGAGSQWDPIVIAHFLACSNELYSICQRGLGDSVFVAVERALDLGGVEDDSHRKSVQAISPSAQAGPR